MFCKTVGVGTTACRKRYVFLLVVIAAIAFALVALNFHTYDDFLASYRQTKEIPCTVSVLDQIALSAFGTSLLRLFALHMKNNCITFVFLSCTFKAI
jgi:hypothetical protein